MMKHPLAIPIRNKLIHKLISKATRLDDLKQIYDDWLSYGKKAAKEKGLLNQGSALLDFGLQHMQVCVDFRHEQRLLNIPKTGPLLIICNHPLGGLEGMLLARELLKIRGDLKVLTNEMLLKFPEFAEIFIGVDVLNKDKNRKNSQGIRQITRHLANAGAMLIFPAGTVSGLNFKTFKTMDKKWSDIVGRLMQRYQCPCIPFFVNDRNSLPFYLSGYLHKRLRTLLLGRAMLAKKKHQVQLLVGDIINHKEVESLDSVEEVTAYLRFCCEVIPENKTALTMAFTQKTAVRANIGQQEIIQQLARLAEYQVIEKGKFSVYCAPYDKLGCIMEQIAISREHTFRAVNEGTGRELDKDRFDPFYWHLWIWDNEKLKLVGGYRLGKVDQIIKQHSIENLYSNSLYHYSEKFSHGLEHAIEVGRSFVCQEYQRHSKVLDLLWRGIGAFMVANPEYNTLFGCVSISKEYSNLARAFLAESLIKHFNAKEEFISSVTAKTPLQIDEKPWSDNLINMLSNIPIINKLLGRIDNGKTIPILIRHYLALNGKFASFTVNTDFNHSLDGLIIVDLRLTPDKYLCRYLGQQGAENFINKWKIYESVA